MSMIHKWRKARCRTWHREHCSLSVMYILGCLRGSFYRGNNPGNLFYRLVYTRCSSQTEPVQKTNYLTSSLLFLRSKRGNISAHLIPSENLMKLLDLLSRKARHEHTQTSVHNFKLNPLEPVHRCLETQSSSAKSSLSSKSSRGNITQNSRKAS